MYNNKKKRLYFLCIPTGNFYKFYGSFSAQFHDSDTQEKFWVKEQKEKKSEGSSVSLQHDEVLLF